MIEGVLKFGGTAVIEGITPWSESRSSRRGCPGMRSSPSRGRRDSPGTRSCPPAARRSWASSRRGRSSGRGAARWERPAREASLRSRVDEDIGPVPPVRRSRVHLAIAIDEQRETLRRRHPARPARKDRGPPCGGSGGRSAPEWEKDGALSVPAATPVRVLREEYGSTSRRRHVRDRRRLRAGLPPVRAGRAGDLPGPRVPDHVAETERFRIRRLRFEKAAPTGTS